MTTNNVPTVNYTESLANAFPAQDMSSQGQSGVTDKMVHTVAETVAFGRGEN